MLQYNFVLLAMWSRESGSKERFQAPEASAIEPGLHTLHHEMRLFVTGHPLGRSPTIAGVTNAATVCWFRTEQGPRCRLAESVSCSESCRVQEPHENFIQSIVSASTGFDPWAYDFQKVPPLLREFCKPFAASETSMTSLEPPPFYIHFARSPSIAHPNRP